MGRNEVPDDGRRIRHPGGQTDRPSGAKASEMTGWSPMGRLSIGRPLALSQNLMQASSPFLAP